MRISFSQLLAVAAASLIASTSAKSKDSSSDAARFTALAKKGKGIIHLDDDLYEELTAAPRDYSVTIVYQALGAQYKCMPCKVFDPEYQLLAKQWQKQPASIRDSHFFAVIDFENGKESFRKLGLTSAPNARVFLPTTGPRAGSPNQEPINIDFSRGGSNALTAESFSQHVATHAKIPLTFKRPPNYRKLIVGSASVIGACVAAVTAWPLVKGVFGNRYVWATATLPFILLMISGQMWNQIRNPPYMSAHKDGTPSYFAGGYGNQFGVETQIVAAVYGVLAFATYTLAFTVPKLDDAARQRAAIYIWTGVFFVMASVLMSVFRFKNGGYPFKLLF